MRLRVLMRDRKAADFHWLDFTDAGGTTAELYKQLAELDRLKYDLMSIIFFKDN